MQWIYGYILPYLVNLQIGATVRSRAHPWVSFFVNVEQQQVAQNPVLIKGYDGSGKSPTQHRHC